MLNPRSTYAMDTYRKPWYFGAAWAPTAGVAGYYGNKALSWFKSGKKASASTIAKSRSAKLKYKAGNKSFLSDAHHGYAYRKRGVRKYLRRRYKAVKLIPSKSVWRNTGNGTLTSALNQQSITMIPAMTEGAYYSAVNAAKFTMINDLGVPVLQDIDPSTLSSLQGDFRVKLLNVSTVVQFRNNSTYPCKMEIMECKVVIDNNTDQSTVAIWESALQKGTNDASAAHTTLNYHWWDIAKNNQNVNWTRNNKYHKLTKYELNPGDEVFYKYTDPKRLIGGDHIESGSAVLPKYTHFLYVKLMGVIASDETSQGPPIVRAVGIASASLDYIYTRRVVLDTTIPNMPADNISVSNTYGTISANPQIAQPDIPSIIAFDDGS